MSVVANSRALNTWRVWLLALLIWAVIVVLFFILGGSDYGFGALIGGAVGMLAAYLTMRLMLRRGWTRKKSG